MAAYLSRHSWKVWPWSGGSTILQNVSN